MIYRSTPRYYYSDYGRYHYPNRYYYGRRYYPASGLTFVLRF